MAAVFLPPNDSVIQSSNAVGDKAKWLLLDEPGLVARSPGQTLTVTFATQAKPFDSIAVIGSTLRSLDTIRVRIGSVADMSSGVMLDQTVRAWTGAAPIDKAISYIPLSLTYTAAFVRLDIVTSAETVEASRIIIGKRIEVDGVDQGAEFTYQSGDAVTDGNGWTSVQDYRSRISWKANAGNVRRASYCADWAPFLARAGKHMGFLFIPQTESDALQVEAALMRHQQEAKVIDVTSERYRIEMQLLEV